MHDCACAPCLHFTRPCDLFESGCFQAGSDDSEDKRDERLEDNLGDRNGELLYRKSKREIYIPMKEETFQVCPVPSSEKDLDGNEHAYSKREVFGRGHTFIG